MDEPIKNYPEYPITLKALCLMAASIVLVGVTGVALYLMVERSGTKPVAQRVDTNVGVKRFERLPNPPDHPGLR